MKKNRFRVDLRKLRIDPDTIGSENLILPHSSDDMIRGSMNPLNLLIEQKKIFYGVIDGQDTARLIKAYPNCFSQSVK